MVSATLLMLGLRTSLAGGAAAIWIAGAALYSKHSFDLLRSATYAWSLLFALMFFLSGRWPCWVPALIRWTRGCPAGE